MSYASTCVPLQPPAVLEPCCRPLNPWRARGAQVLAGAKTIEVDKSTSINIRMAVEHLSFSAHADAKGAARLAKRCRWAQRAHVVHQQPALRARIFHQQPTPCCYAGIMELIKHSGAQNVVLVHGEKVGDLPRAFPNALPRQFRKHGRAKADGRAVYAEQNGVSKAEN